MAIWLKNGGLSINLNFMVSVESIVDAKGVDVVNIKDTSGAVNVIEVKSAPDGEELKRIIVETVNSGGDVDIDSEPFKK